MDFLNNLLSSFMALNPYDAALNLSPDNFNLYLQQQYSAGYEALKEFTKPKPCIYCYKYCPVPAEHCSACRAEQEAIHQQILDLEKLEEYHKNPTPQWAQAVVQSAHPRITYCRSCGASYKEGRTTCEFCNTPYELPVNLSSDYPDSPIQRRQLIATKSEEIMGRMYNLRLTQYNYFRNHPSYATLHQIPYFKDEPVLLNLNANAMAEGAAYYNVNISTHIQELARGNHQNIADIKSAQFEAQQAAEQRAREEQSARRVQEYEAMLSRYAPTPPRYAVPGSNSCCGNCRWYGRDGKCFQNGYSKNASDRCGLYEYK